MTQGSFGRGSTLLFHGRSGRVTLVLVVLAFLMHGLAFPLEVASDEAPADIGTAWELEGMRPGMEFVEMDARFRLQDLVPLVLQQERRYILEATRPLPSIAEEDLKARGIDRMELVFDEEQLLSIRVGYAGKAEQLFDDMAQELTGRLGQPTSVIQRGPMNVGRSRGIRLYLWLMIWTWEADGRTLSVEGKHYGVDKVKEQAKSHEYVFTLKETARD